MEKKKTRKGFESEIVAQIIYGVIAIEILNGIKEKLNKLFEEWNKKQIKKK